MLAQDNSTQGATPALNVSRESIKTFQFFWIITSSGKQSDQEVETSFVHLMQMYMFDIAEAKYHYPAPPWHNPGGPQGPSICKFFFSSIHLLCGRARKIWCWSIYLMLRGEDSTQPLGETYQAQMSGAHTNWVSKCPGRGSGGKVE